MSFEPEAYRILRAQYGCSCNNTGDPGTIEMGKNFTLSELERDVTREKVDVCPAIKAFARLPDKLHWRRSDEEDE